jgi:TrmH family RNA methyltransferase
MTLVTPPEWKVEDLFRGQALIAVLDGIQDPGNAGTIARAAEAFGASGILFLKGTVSPWNPKVLRAGTGSLFRVPFLHGVDGTFALATLQQHEVGLFAGMPPAPDRTVTPVTSIDLTRPSALIIGSEAHGVREELTAAAMSVAIPTAGVESLNAALAAGILLYEASRQRMLRP